MHVIADLGALVRDGVITEDAAQTMQRRARATMMRAAINALLTLGVVFATAGLIALLADAAAVALCGGVLLACGAAVLGRGRRVYAMFGSAAGMIGAGLLLGGATVKLAQAYPDAAPAGTALLGLVAMACVLALWRRGAGSARAVLGAVGLAGLGLHLGGLGAALFEAETVGLVPPLFWLYAAAAVAAAGWLTDIRWITALAIAPFAQALDTGTLYFHAAYVFVSPEPTLSILQMGLAMAAALWLAARSAERTARHARIVALLAFVVANLCALVGSLWGDVVGETVWGPARAVFDDPDAYFLAQEAFRADALRISEHAFAIAWAVVLIAMAAYAAQGARRGLFNAAMTFGTLHAYTQAFESFHDQPLAYVVGGLAAIPLAWGLWRVNKAFPGHPRPPRLDAGPGAREGKA